MHAPPTFSPPLAAGAAAAAGAASAFLAAAGAAAAAAGSALAGAAPLAAGAGAEVEAAGACAAPRSSSAASKHRLGRTDSSAVSCSTQGAPGQVGRNRCCVGRCRAVGHRASPHSTALEREVHMAPSTPNVCATPALHLAALHLAIPTRLQHTLGAGGGGGVYVYLGLSSAMRGKKPAVSTVCCKRSAQRSMLQKCRI